MDGCGGGIIGYSLKVAGYSLVQNYRDLKVWQKAREVVKSIYLLTHAFPSEQKYVLTAQMQRAAISVPSNIAEGRTRHSENDFIYHINIARGSLAELETQLTLAYDLQYISELDHERTLKQTREVMMMLHGLRDSMKKLQPVT